MLANPLLEKSTLSCEAINFNVIKVEHFIPALNQAIDEARQNIKALKQVQDISFDSVILAFETASDRLDLVTGVFYALYSAHCSDELSAIAEEFNVKLTAYSSDINLDAKLFSKIKQLYENQEKLNLSTEQQTVLENSYKGFTRNGALLDDKDKQKLREIDQKLSQLSLTFSENVRKANHEYFLTINNEKDLIGMPQGVIDAAREAAEQKKLENAWVFTLDVPSYLPFMQYCQNRDLRKQMWLNFSSRAMDGKYGNQDNILKILKYRQQRAQLLGYKDHPHYVLERRMAGSSQKVNKFIDEIIDKFKALAMNDFKQLKDLFEDLHPGEAFRKYDAAFITEKLKKQQLDFDDEALRPYFKLENVIEGVFKTAEKLYGIQFIENQEIPVYHPDVKVYVVNDHNGEYLGLFYADFFPRKEKRPGAWMTTFRSQGYQMGEVKRPFVSIVCNFTKPTSETPSLLSLNEVITLFHEFGHSLHGLLTKVTYKSVSGTSVYWDFVELPSQIMENWVIEKECLDLFARHYQTNEAIPDSLINKIKKSRQFLQGLTCLRQMSFAKLDMCWHLADIDSIDNVVEFEKNLIKDFDFYPEEEATNMSCSFGHIFSGGYSSGYYSYKWAEVLDADAFSVFQNRGLFEQTTATRFRTEILEKGGTEDPMILYKNFRGQEPGIQALLRRSGIE